MAIPDEASLLATMAYIDLNTVAAKLKVTPESSLHMSNKNRIDHRASTEPFELV